MRELKFRAWDKKAEGMSPEFVLFGEFTLLGAVHDWQRSLAFANGLENYQDSLGRLNDLEVMQFTGLKDKKGKEIYEGDICLKHWSKETYGDRTPEVGVIKWVDFGGRYTHESNGLYGHKYYCELYENLTNPEYPRSLFEVIGNIYENPELLKQ